MTTEENVAVYVILGIVAIIFSVIVISSLRHIAHGKWAAFWVITLVSIFAFIIAIAFT